MDLKLTRHSGGPPSRLDGVEVSVRHISQDFVHVWWQIRGAYDLVVPALANPARKDGLWRRTCFEMFFRPQDELAPYHELNFSPSGEWAAYSFSAYRSGMVDLPLNEVPICEYHPAILNPQFSVRIPLKGLPPLPWLVKFAAVIEENDGNLTYWAERHPDGPPNFHDLSCISRGLFPPDEDEIWD